MMIWLRVPVVIAGAFVAAAAAADDPGIWVPDDNFAQLNVFCSRVYRCTAGHPLMHSAETQVVFTPNELVTGVCSVAGGPADSCNVCLTNPPPVPCVYRLEKK